MPSRRLPRGYFNPLPPRGGRRQRRAGARLNHNFNPLPPRGGRLDPAARGRGRRKHFNPLPPRGGRLVLCDEIEEYDAISIHSLLAEGDLMLGTVDLSAVISIHSLLAEGDISITAHEPRPKDFNPLPPRGGRRFPVCDLRAPCSNFNPLPPRGGRLSSFLSATSGQYFNPLPPRGGRQCVGYI